jgi:serine/threonine protein kinase
MNEPERLPERIGRYRVTDTLGEGGMGVVYAAFDEQLERPIALKIIRQDSAADPVARERFWREGRLAARVNHPHICQLYEIGESDGQLFIAMERLEGEPLAARLRRGAVPLADAVQIGLEVLAALDALLATALRTGTSSPRISFSHPMAQKCSISGSRGRHPFGQGDCNLDAHRLTRCNLRKPFMTNFFANWDVFAAG